MATACGAGHVAAMHHSTFRLSREPTEEPLQRLLAAAGDERAAGCHSPGGGFVVGVRSASATRAAGRSRATPSPGGRRKPSARPRPAPPSSVASLPTDHTRSRGRRRTAAARPPPSGRAARRAGTPARARPATAATSPRSRPRYIATATRGRRQAALRPPAELGRDGPAHRRRVGRRQHPARRPGRNPPARRSAQRAQQRGPQPRRAARRRRPQPAAG